MSDLREAKMEFIIEKYEEFDYDNVTRVSCYSEESENLYLTLDIHNIMLDIIGKNVFNVSLCTEMDVKIHDYVMDTRVIENNGTCLICSGNGLLFQLDYGYYDFKPDEKVYLVIDVVKENSVN